MDWLYDRSFGGFLTAIFRIYAAHDPEPRIWPDQAGVPNPAREADLFEQMTGTDTMQPPQTAPAQGNYATFIPAGYDEALAKRVMEGLRKKAGQEAAQTLRNAFLHREPGAENLLFDFVRQCMDYGNRTLRKEADPAVRITLDRARSVAGEAHRFMGILRFVELEGHLGLYGAMEPDHNILALLGEHFLPRMGCITWMIHDRGRSLALCCRDGELDVLEGVAIDADLPLSAREQEFQSLWQGFFKAIANPGRLNPRVQMSHMPKKYWKHLVEIPGSSRGQSGAATTAIALPKNIGATALNT